MKPYIKICIAISFLSFTACTSTETAKAHTYQSASKNQAKRQILSPVKTLFETTSFSTKPESPKSFGYKTSWFAIHTSDTEGVISNLRLSNVKPANWSSGLYRDFEIEEKATVFVMPPIEGWTIVQLDLNLAADTEQNIKDLHRVLKTLSSEFKEAQYFGSYRVVDYASWIIAKDGKIVRAFSFAGGGDGYILNEGATTKEELSIGFGDISGMSIEELNNISYGPDADNVTRWPDEDDPHKLAELWSINPLKITDMSLEENIGYVGILAFKR